MTYDPPGPGRKAASGAAGARLQGGVRLNDRYEIEEFLGRTPYGESYRARDLASGQLVSILAVAPELIADDETMTRLGHAIETAAQLDHKNIAATYGFFGAEVGDDAIAYLASEFVEGQTLRSMVDKKRAQGRAFSLKGAYNVAAHLCNALQYAHSSMIHGALTPATVMVNSAGRVKIAAFGLGATLHPFDQFQAQVADGTLAALAPEMAQSPERADARADVYSVGVILFELLTGRTPADSFERPSLAATGVPAAVDSVVETCLRPSPDERYSDAGALKAALQAALAPELSGERGQAQVSRPIAVGVPASAPPRPAQVPTPPAMPKAAPQQRVTPPAMPKAVVPSAPPAQPDTKRPSLQQAAVPKSFNVDAALSAVDSDAERWLIQKDKLDFGPFNMRDLRAQIETGKVRGEHVIVDTENGERRRVAEHPQLRKLVLDAEARLSSEEREREERQQRRKHQGRVVTILTFIFVAILAGSGGIFWYYKNHQRVVVQKEIVHDNEYDFMKGLQISMKVDPPAVKKPRPGRRPGQKVGKNEYSDTTNLGDASSEGGDETLDQAVVQRVMTQNFRVLVGCIAEERKRNSALHTVDMDFIIKGAGNVSAVKVNGSTTSPLAGCMYGKMQSVSFPKFNGASTHASFSLNLK